MTSNTSRLAIYAGTFDPITNGHLDILQRSLTLFDHLIIAVAENPQKKPLFSPPERKILIQEALPQKTSIQVDIFSGLLVKYAKERGATCIIRGLRVLADFEYEFQLAHINRSMAPEIETVFLMTDKQTFYVSSSMVKEIARWKGDVSALVPPNVAVALKKRLSAQHP